MENLTHIFILFQNRLKNYIQLMYELAFLSMIWTETC